VVTPTTNCRRDTIEIFFESDFKQVSCTGKYVVFLMQKDLSLISENHLLFDINKE